MSRMIASWGVGLVVVVSVGLSFGQGKASNDPAKAAEELLAARDLHRSAEMYVLRGEDEVKKAADAADARLKEYRLAIAREKSAFRDAFELTKERDEMKQQMAHTMPALRLQIQTLTQQQAALYMQMNSTQAGNSGYNRMQGNPLMAQYQQLGAQIATLQAQGNQLTADFNELDQEVRQLRPRTGKNAVDPTKKDAKAQVDPAKKDVKAPVDLAKKDVTGPVDPAKKDDKGPVDPAKKEFKGRAPSPEDQRKKAYIKALGELRKHVDEVSPKYPVLAEDDEVKTALATLSQRSAKIKYVLGPSKKFLDTVAALEQAEARVASDTILDAPRSADSAKRKTKTSKKK